MKVSKENLFSIGSELKIPQEKLSALWTGLEKQDAEISSSSPFTKFLFYLGALIVISAMTWFMSFGWELFGGGGIFLIAACYGVTLTLVGNWLWRKRGFRIPAGLLITIAVCMTPLAIYGLESYFNLWPDQSAEGSYPDLYYWIQGKWILVEIGTILAGILAIRFYPFPFLTAPIFVAAWFLTMDIVPFVFGSEISLQERYWLALFFGLVLMVISFIIERRTKEDYAFWGYLFGTLSFWIGLNTLVWDKGEGILFLYLIISLLMMIVSIILRRNVLMIFGAIGVMTYLGHLAYSLFQDSILFPFVLSAIGLGIIYLGILYQKNAKKIEQYVQSRLPSSLKR